MMSTFCGTVGIGVRRERQMGSPISFGILPIGLLSFKRQVFYTVFSVLSCIAHHSFPPHSDCLKLDVRAVGVAVLASDVDVLRHQDGRRSRLIQE